MCCVCPSFVTGAVCWGCALSGPWGSLPLAPFSLHAVCPARDAGRSGAGGGARSWRRWCMVSVGYADWHGRWLRLLPAAAAPSQPPLVQRALTPSGPEGEHPHGAPTASDILVAEDRCRRGRPRVFCTGVHTESALNGTSISIWQGHHDSANCSHGARTASDAPWEQLGLVVDAHSHHGRRTP